MGVSPRNALALALRDVCIIVFCLTHRALSGEFTQFKRLSRSIALFAEEDYPYSFTNIFFYEMCVRSCGCVRVRACECDCVRVRARVCVCVKPNINHSDSHSLFCNNTNTFIHT